MSDPAGTADPAAAPDRRIAILTTGRQDWGILRSTALGLLATPGVEVLVAAGGMHLSQRHGLSVHEIRADGVAVAAELPWLDPDADPPAQVQAARALEVVGAWLDRERPDALVLVGDRLETASAALAATLTRTPIVHLHGGEQSGGAFDDALRHAITKLAHLHLVSHEEHAARVRALGEDPASIHVVGAPGLDNAVRSDLPNRSALEADLGIALDGPIIVVTVQPATLDPDPAAVVRPVLAAMNRVPGTYVITLPNSDLGAASIRDALQEAAAADGRRVAVDALGARRYWGLLRIADAMLGNSSSGLIEAPAFDLPAVDVGDRQQGRRREANVLTVPATDEAVEQALRRAIDPSFRALVTAAHPPLVDGHAGTRTARIINAWRPQRPPRKAPILVRVDAT